MGHKQHAKHISQNEPLPAGLTTTGNLFLGEYDHPLPDVVMACWVTQQITRETP